jgi:TRAP-type C4-dicarboxylate transport system permease large subunit
MLAEGWPFIVALLTLLLAITLVPELVLALPRMAGYAA